MQVVVDAGAFVSVDGRPVPMMIVMMIDIGRMHVEREALRLQRAHSQSEHGG